MQYKIGVMQGRLLPKYLGRYQAFPVGVWQDEFSIAQELNLDLIEFILDFNDVENNPLLKKGGIEKIKSIINKTGVSVKSICADYFMEAPLHSKNKKLTIKSTDVLLRLLANAKILGVQDVVIPCVDKASLNNEGKVERFVENLSPIVKFAEEYGINLSLETDLNPKKFLTLLESFQSKKVTVNYDIGNSAALGYDIVEELDCYGSRISDIHIKDRIFRGDPVVLGKGNADFKKFFDKLRKINYNGPFIMQAYRDDKGVEIFKDQLEWIKPFFKRLHQ